MMDARNPPPAKAKPKKKGGGFKGELYRQGRAWHGYLSAFAFLALIFFAFTGLMLNHPGWFERKRPPASERVIVVPAPVLAQAAKAEDPSRALTTAVGRLTPMRGEFRSGEIIDGQAMIRLEGVSGATDLTVDMADGRAEVVMRKADFSSIVEDLHRGKNAGAVWRLIIDLTAVLVLALSLIGYVLFFSLRFRLRTSLILTGLSLAGVVGIFVFLTP